MAKERRIAALDTCALSFFQQGLAAGCTEEERQRSARIGHYMNGVRADGGQVILPSVAMGEYLANYPDDQRKAAKDGVG